MKARHLFTALLALTTVTAVACDDEDEDVDAPPDTNTFTATLNGASEKPTATTATATGSAQFVATTTGSTTTIQYTVTVTGNLSGPVTAAHIHGPAGVNDVANPIVTLSVTSQTPTGVVVSGSFTSTGGATTMAQLLTYMEAGQTYINLHTTANPSGEIRGQIND